MGMEPRPRILPTLAKCVALSVFSWSVVMGAAWLRDWLRDYATRPAQAAPQPGQPGYDAMFTDPKGKP